ncbi:MAG TPA: hypothetical protein VGU22_05250 [Methylomirabilota bacterium]|nr:hypothetical protein [Methylomirabilota bacterium]
MKRMVSVMALVAVLAGTGGAALAADTVERTFTAPVDRVWATTVSVLKVMGWDIDKEDRTIGALVTESRRLEGEDYGVYAKGIRHRLRLMIKAVDNARTLVSVQREVFKRERILFVDKDEPIMATDQNVEKALLDSIGRAL